MLVTLVFMNGNERTFPEASLAVRKGGVVNVSQQLSMFSIQLMRLKEIINEYADVKILS